MTAACLTCADGIALHAERLPCVVCGIHTALCCVVDDRGHLCVACIYQRRRRRPDDMDPIGPDDAWTGGEPAVVMTEDGWVT